MGQNVGPPRGPGAGPAARPETCFGPAGSTGGPCRTGPGAPAGTPQTEAKLLRNPVRRRLAARRPGGGANAPTRWPRVAVIEDRRGARGSRRGREGHTGGRESVRSRGLPEASGTARLTSQPRGATEVAAARARTGPRPEPHGGRWLRRDRGRGHAARPKSRRPGADMSAAGADRALASGASEVAPRGATGSGRGDARERPREVRSAGAG